jgi:histidinol dehydrogenase
VTIQYIKQGKPAEVKAELNARVYCITSSKAIAAELPAAVDKVLARLDTAPVASVSWRDYGEIILCDTQEEMLREAERLCAEHVQVMPREPDWFLQRMTRYGALFLGHRTNVSYGDKVIGTNHTRRDTGGRRAPAGLAVRPTESRWRWPRHGPLQRATTSVNGSSDRLQLQ